MQGGVQSRADGEELVQALWQNWRHSSRAACPCYLLSHLPLRPPNLTNIDNVHQAVLCRQWLLDLHGPLKDPVQNPRPDFQLHILKTPKLEQVSWPRLIQASGDISFFAEGLFCEL